MCQYHAIKIVSFKRTTKKLMTINQMIKYSFIIDVIFIENKVRKYHFIFIEGKMSVSEKIVVHFRLYFKMKISWRKAF